MIRTSKDLASLIFLALLVSLVARPTGFSSAAGTAFTENWTAASSSFLNLMDMTGGSGNAATSNVADTGASDGKALRFTPAPKKAQTPNRQSCMATAPTKPASKPPMVPTNPIMYVDWVRVYQK